MKFPVLSVLCLGSAFFGCAWAQTAAAPQPAAKPLALPDLPADAKVAQLDDGTIVTMGELRGLLSNLEPQQQQQAASNLQEFLNQWSLFRKIAQMGLDQKLDQQSPTKERLMWQRTLVMFDAEVQQRSNPERVDPDEIEKYYNDHKSQYAQVKTSAIYIAFSNSAASQVDSDGKKILSEAEAKAKITGLLEQIRKGADFKKLVKENSDDEPSRAKDGFFATLTPANTGIPDAIRKAVFALKAGETTEPIFQPNGYYLFRADEVGYQPFAEVRDQVYSALKLERFNLWFQGIRNQSSAKILNPAIK
jgi:parvulin-like peptidyl-prolyl isomerase